MPLEDVMAPIRASCRCVCFSARVSAVRGCVCMSQNFDRTVLSKSHCNWAEHISPQSALSGFDVVAPEPVSVFHRLVAHFQAT